MSRTRNLSTGSLAEHFLHLAVPAGIGMLFTTLYNVVDMFFAGLIGTDEQAGLAISFQAFFIFITFGFGLSAAMTALVGNAIGARDDYAASQIAMRGIGFGLLISALLTVGSSLAWSTVDQAGLDRGSLQGGWNSVFHDSGGGYSIFCNVVWYQRSVAVAG